MDHKFKELLVLRDAKENGDGTVLKITTKGDTVIHAISVAREGFSYTGPTWTYLFESDGLTLIDAGEAGSLPRLEDGLAVAGFKLQNIDRVIISHGHEDHDGAVSELVEKADIEVWAHEIYAHLQAYDPRTISRRVISPIQKEMWRVADLNRSFPPTSPQRDEYVRRRQALTIDHPIKANETIGKLLLRQLEIVGPPKWTDEHITWFQELVSNCAPNEAFELHRGIDYIDDGYDTSSQDDGEASWHIPLGRISWALPSAVPFHHWARTACAGRLSLIHI